MSKYLNSLHRRYQFKIHGKESWLSISRRRVLIISKVLRNNLGPS